MAGTRPQQCATGGRSRGGSGGGRKARRSMIVAFRAYGRSLAAVSEFKYLGRFLTASYNGWPAHGSGGRRF